MFTRSRMFFLLCLTTAPIAAQSANSCDQCRGLITGGVFQTQQFQQSGNKELVFQSWACSHSYEEVRSALSGGLDVHILGPLYGGSGSFDKSDFEARKASSCNSIQSQMSESSANQSISQTGDPTIVNGFVKCMSVCKPEGFFVFVDDTGDDPVVHVQYKQSQTGSPKLRVTPPFALPEGVSVRGRTGPNANVLFPDQAEIAGPTGELQAVLDRTHAPGSFAVSVATVDVNGAAAFSAVGQIPAANAKMLALENASLAPIGSVMAYAGPVDASHKLPDHWLLCDGAALTAAAYPALFAAIGTAHGDGRDRSDNKVADFNLPDYRGYFLRGVSELSSVDPDADSRTAAKTGGFAKNAVGSKQSSQFAEHTHPTDPHNHGVTAEGKPTLFFVNNYPNPGTHSQGGIFGGVLGSGPFDVSAVSAPATVNVQKVGGKETRPTNANVYWIIRVK